MRPAFRSLRSFHSTRITRGALVALAGGLAVLLATSVTRPHIGDPFLTFAAFVLVTELLDTQLPSGRQLSLSLAPGLAFAMLEGSAEHTSSAAIVGLTYLIAASVAATVRAIASREVRIPSIAASFLTVTAAAALYDALIATGPVHLTSRDGIHLASGAGLLAVLALAITSEALRALLAEGTKGRPTVAPTWRSLSSTAPLQTAIMSIAALAALAFPRLGGWSFPLFLGPLTATRYAFRQIAAIRTTEVQTLRALSKIPEMAGYTHPGHSQRVAELSVALGAELGMTVEELRDIEYAALLHDIGRVVLEDPSTERATNEFKLEIAHTGANIVAAAGTFPDVARMIRDQHELHRRRGETHNADVPLGSRILKVANTYDDLLHPDAAGSGPWDVLEHLHQGQAHEYDPEVVAALSEILTRSGEI